MKPAHILLIIFALFVGWRAILLVEKSQQEKKQHVAATEVKPEKLTGMPPQLQTSFDLACQRGPTAVRDWLKAYGHLVSDPRKGWIELDYCVSIVRDNPVEAKRIFAEVKSRTPQNSPIQFRIRDLETTLE